VTWVLTLQYTCDEMVFVYLLFHSFVCADVVTVEGTKSLTALARRVNWLFVESLRQLRLTCAREIMSR